MTAKHRPPTVEPPIAAGVYRNLQCYGRCNRRRVFILGENINGDRAWYCLTCKKERRFRKEDEIWLKKELASKLQP